MRNVFWPNLWGKCKLRVDFVFSPSQQEQEEQHKYEEKEPSPKFIRRKVFAHGLNLMEEDLQWETLNGGGPIVEEVL